MQISSVLLDENVDIPYEFKVSSYNQYGSLAETLKEFVRNKVALRGGDAANKTTSEVKITT